jgi:hypothetical protein
VILDPRIPGGLTPHRLAVLQTALAEVGTREKTGRNDGDVEKYMPEWARGDGLPYCAWFCGWVLRQVFGKHPYDQHIGGVWELLLAARKRGDVLGLGAPAPALRPQPGDVGIILHNGPGKAGPGHAYIILRVSAEGGLVNTIEGNWRNQVGIATRALSDAEGVINPYLRMCDDYADCLALERDIIDAPFAGNGLASTR